MHQLNPERYPFLLESQRHTNENSRYDILFAYPQERVSSNKGDFLSLFEEAFTANREHSQDTAKLPFMGGWFVYLSYELIADIEPKLAHIAIDGALPLAVASRIPVAIIKDHLAKQTWLISEPKFDLLLEEITADIKQSSLLKVKPAQAVQLSEAESTEAFTDGVSAVLDYLKEGDTLQVNLSRRWLGEFDIRTDYTNIYQSLKENNPAPFSGLAVIDGQAICSSSPERLVRSRKGVVDMRPIAGTRPRSDDVKADKGLADQLLSDSKESAEHIMLLDLIRNDLGRICQTGTIKVDEKMSLESYATVHHIVSNIRGELSEGLTPVDIIKAVFPGGTITGCPKIRCMEIISELEKEPRGAYTGSMGYVNLNGDMDLNILIRSMVVRNKALTFRAGAGIVADSQPTNELEETRHKAAGLINALASKC